MLAVWTRVRQFLLTWGSPDERELALAKERLSGAEWRLFSSMRPREQAHALRVAAKALELAVAQGVGEREQDLLVRAALLHDIGKGGAVGPWDKVFIVLARRLAPGIARRLVHIGERAASGEGGAPRPLRPLAIAFHFDHIHPSRGAQLAEAAGADPRVIGLIRSHQASEHNDPLGELLAEADKGS